MNSSFFDFQVFLPPTGDISVVGQHQKKVTILCDYSDDTTEQIDFLRKIMSAAKFDLDTDVALIQLKNQQDWQFVSYQRQSQPKYCISFGVTPQRMGLQFNTQPYQPFSYADCTFLFAHPLANLQENVAYKGALWKCLQHLFLKK
ncbi:MAG: hypothetical protein AB8G22_15225 [Saprospiraceae bacterium]